jgi:rod shape-determining protein MreD
MLSSVLINIARFVLLILLQGLIFNELNLFKGLAIPYLYVLFLLMLPLEMPRWLELLIGLITGLAIDMFTNTIGLHASACVALCYVRPLMLSAIAPRDGYEFGQTASISDFGLSWYLKYAIVMVVIHHSWLFFVEVYSFSGFGHTILRIILSSALTIMLIVLTQYLTYSRKSSGYA